MDPERIDIWDDWPDDPATTDLAPRIEEQIVARERWEHFQDRLREVGNDVRRAVARGHRMKAAYFDRRRRGRE